MQSFTHIKLRTLLLYAVFAFAVDSAPALAVGGPPLASGPERATNDPYYNTLNKPSGGGYGWPDSHPSEKRRGCRSYNTYSQYQPYCQ